MRNLFKMKVTPYLSLLVIITFAFACQKEITDDITPGSGNATTSFRIKTYTEDYTSAGGPRSTVTFNVSYDANGRISSSVSTTSPGDKFVYGYSTNSFTVDLYNSNVLSIHTLFFLNSFSLPDSSFQYNDTNDTSTAKYTYNSAQQLTKLRDYDYKVSTGAVLFNTTDYTYDGNGNVLTETDNNSVSTYDYYTNLPNNITTGADYFYKNKNLTKTTKITSGGSTDTLNHTYTFDASNRVSTEKITISNGDVMIKTYTY